MIQTIKKGYKQTEVGVIPEDWEVITLSEVFEFKNGLNKEKHFFGQGTPIVNYMDVYKNAGIYQKDLSGRVTLTSQEIKNYEVKKGDVFFTRTSETIDEIGISTVVLEDFKKTVFSGFVLRARSINDKLDNFFKKYCFSTQEVRKEITSKSSYTTRALTNGRLLSAVNLAIPKEKAEQTAIATALSDTDALIASMEKLIAKKRNIKQGAMQKLLTPKAGWEVEPVKKITTICTGAKNTQDKIDDGSFPFFVRSQIIEKINSYSFDGEAVLVAGDGVGTGKVVHYFHGKFDFHQRVYKISDFKSMINGFYFYLYFKNNFLNRIMLMTAKSSVDSVRMDMISEMKIPFPPKEVQTKIATILSDMDAEIKAIETKLEKYKMLKQGMMQNLLTGKIRLI